MSVLALLLACSSRPLSGVVDSAVDRPLLAEGGMVVDAGPGQAVEARATDTLADGADADPCQPGFGLCPADAAASLCVDLNSNHNCGACGRACRAGTTCVNGDCTSVCPAGTSYCPEDDRTACVDLASATDHCGQCGHACATGEICREALCQPACRTTLAWDSAQMLMLAMGTTAVTAGDFDRDGYLDFASTTYRSVDLWHNRGDGGFDPLPMGLPAMESAVQSAGLYAQDFDGNGRLDVLLAVSDRTTGTRVERFLLFSASSTGDFLRTGEAGPVEESSRSTSAVADMDGDGRADLVVAEAQRLALWRGQVDGSLKPAGFVGTSATLTYPLVADVNGDGKPDVIASDQEGSLFVLLGAGGGALLPEIVSPMSEDVLPQVAADVNGDGILEIACRSDNGALLLHGAGDGRFTDKQTLESDSDVYEMVFFDLNKDGALDFIRNTREQELRISLGNGDGSYGPPRRYANSPSAMLTVADFDHDGEYDVAALNASPRVLLLLKGRNGDFPGVHIHAEDEVPTAGTVWSGPDPVQADLNGDGIPDTVELVNSASLEVTLGGATATQPTVSFPVGGARTFLVTDLDHDGHLDLAFATRSAGTVTLLLGRGDGGFDRRLTVVVGAMSDDVMGVSAPRTDGRQDLLFRRKNSQIGILTSTSRGCAAMDGGAH